MEPISEITHNASLNTTEATGTASIAITVPKVTLSFLIYGIAGPNFEMGMESGIKGTSSKEGDPLANGIAVDGNVEVSADVSLTAGEFKLLADSKSEVVNKFFKNVSFEYTPVTVNVFKSSIFARHWFFPFADDFNPYDMDGFYYGYSHIETCTIDQEPETQCAFNALSEQLLRGPVSPDTSTIAFRIGAESLNIRIGDVHCSWVIGSAGLLDCRGTGNYSESKQCIGATSPIVAEAGRTFTVAVTNRKPPSEQNYGISHNTAISILKCNTLT